MELDNDLMGAWAWFSTNMDKWTDDTPLTAGLMTAIQGVEGPSGPHREPHWQWVRDNREDLLALHAFLTKPAQP